MWPQVGIWGCAGCPWNRGSTSGNPLPWGSPRRRDSDLQPPGLKSGDRARGARCHYDIIHFPFGRDPFGITSCPTSRIISQLVDETSNECGIYDPSERCKSIWEMARRALESFSTKSMGCATDPVHVHFYNIIFHTLVDSLWSCAPTFAGLHKRRRGSSCL